MARTRRPKRTNEQIMKALEATGGVLVHAAQKLQMSRDGVWKRIKKSPQLQRFFEDVVESKLDLAESKLMELVEAGNLAAIIFYLKCRGKHRGWVERQEIDHRGDLTVQVVRYADVSKGCECQGNKDCGCQKIDDVTGTCDTLEAH